MNVLDEVMTVSEAARRWGKDVRTIRQACTSGATWLITVAGMTRVFGPEPDYQ